MSGAAPEPPVEPPVEPPEGDEGATDLEDFVRQLAGFDPGAISTKLDELSAKLSLDLGGITEIGDAVSAAVREALEGPMAELTKTVKDLARQVKGQSATPPSATPDTPAQQPTGAGRSGVGGGVAETLFGVPTISRDAPPS